MTMRVEPFSYPAAPSRIAATSGWVMSGLVTLFMLQDAAIKLIGPDGAKSATQDLGYPIDQLTILGLVLLACTVLYAVPRTALLGAILLTGYLGGAVAINARIESGWLLFPVALGVLAWVGLALRDRRVNQLLRSMIDA